MGADDLRIDAPEDLIGEAKPGRLVAAQVVGDRVGLAHELFESRPSVR